MPKPAFSKNNSGQVLLLVLLSMVTVLTISLSIAARSTVEVATTSYEEDASRAFSAAEAGVEQALIKESGVEEIDLGNNTSVSAEVTRPTQGSSFTYTSYLYGGETASFWFVSHDPISGRLTCPSCTRTSQVDICWGDGSSSSVPAIEVAVFFDTSRTSTDNPNNYSDVQVRRQAYDPDSSRAAANGFTYYNRNCSDISGFRYRASIDLASLVGGSCAVGGGEGCLMVVKVRMFYIENSDSPQPVAIIVRGGPNPFLPDQGILVESVGEANESK